MIQQASREEIAKWDLILLGYNLGMARGIGRTYYGETYAVIENSQAFKYVADERTSPTNKQHLTRLNTEQWADPTFRIRRSLQVAKEQSDRWKDPKYKAMMAAAKSRGWAKRRANAMKDKDTRQ